MGSSVSLKRNASNTVVASSSKSSGQGSNLVADSGTKVSNALASAGDVLKKKAVGAAEYLRGNANRKFDAVSKQASEEISKQRLWAAEKASQKASKLSENVRDRATHSFNAISKSLNPKRLLEVNINPLKSETVYKGIRRFRNAALGIGLTVVFVYAVGSSLPTALTRMYLELDSRQREEKRNADSNDLKNQNGQRLV